MSKVTVHGCLRIWLIAIIAGLLGVTSVVAETPVWEVEGAGFLQNRRLRKQLDLINNSEKEHFYASDIEDAALVLISFLQGQGYLGAEATVSIFHSDGRKDEVQWDGKFDVFLPRDTLATRVRFDLRKGPRYYYEGLEVRGGTILKNEEVVSFFYSEGLVLQDKQARVYSPGGLASSASNLESHLRSLGYKDAEVVAEELDRDLESGGVRAVVSIAEGSYYSLDTIDVVYLGDSLESLDLREYEGQAYSRFLTQDIHKKTRNAFYVAGYPDVKVTSSPAFVGSTNVSERVRLDLRVESGDRIKIGGIAFSGAKETKESVFRKRLDVSEGDWFNPLAIDRSRMSLGRLGIFEEVSLNVGDTTDLARSLDFQLLERRPWSVDLLMGWGSYEQLRGGIVAERTNILGLAHRARFTGTLSMKSSLAELRYLMPEIFNTPTSVTSRLFALNREEVSFDRQEVGMNLGLSRRFDRYDVESTLLYTYESLEAQNVVGGEDSESLKNAKVGSIQLRLSRDHRDSPLNPREGNRFYSKLEVAERLFGGQVDYQRFELGFSSHGDFKRGLFWHGSLSHGVIGVINGDERSVPTNKLFFPGGESSIRGFTSGAAGPLDYSGDSVKNVGARSYLLANLELEQYLSETISTVMFVDGIGVTRTLAEYPFDETLVSVGLGVRLKTFMGPIRLEYGHNVKKRDLDPKGALHFSIGFPF